MTEFPEFNAQMDRRAFVKVTALAGSGLVLGFNWLAGSPPAGVDARTLLNEWFPFNGYLRISDTGQVTITSPNPEFGQNVMTSMPMIVADELDIDWKDVIVEQAKHDPARFPDAAFGQFTGGSRGIASKWEALRKAGASARHMLREAAAQAWQVPVAEVTTSKGVLTHAASGKSARYGEMASAAARVPVPATVTLKSARERAIVGTPRHNVEGRKIVTGAPLFGIDYQQDGMLIAMIVHPPAFGLEVKSVDDAAARAMPGITDVFRIQTLTKDTPRGMFDTNAFPELVAIVGRTTWEVMKAKKALKVEWAPAAESTFAMSGFGNRTTVTVPAGLESSASHTARMKAAARLPGRTVRKDGDPDAAFRTAAKVIERSYSAPFLPHNCMEPMNFFAHVTDDGVKVAGPLQAPGMIEPTLAARLGMPPEKVEIEMTRMGGGFGRRAYSHYAIEAALISQKVKAPVKLLYTREDDMTTGIYRPAYHATYRAALDAAGNLVALHVRAGGVPESPLFADRFPAGAVDHYLAEDWTVPSNITIGAFRAPRSNFMAAAEQSFLDEVAEAAGKDPIAFRLELLRRAKARPVGTRNEYEVDRYIGVLELVRDKSAWATAPRTGVHRGVAAYFCHGSYAAHVLELTVEGGRPMVQKVTSAIDCGIVVNPDAATNMVEGAVIDGIGNAFFGGMTFKDGAPEQSNFDRYRMIRMREAPRAMSVHFVPSEIAPTGLGEPPFPPVFGAVANAMYRATGKRQYTQPFLSARPVIG